MKGQPIMKHAKDLIGASVHVYSRNFKDRPDLPRHAVISGFGADDGMFNVTITHSFADQIGGLPPFGYLERCLVIDDPDDLPIGISEYAILTNPVYNNNGNDRTNEHFRKIAGKLEGETKQDPEQETKPEPEPDHKPEPEREDSDPEEAEFEPLPEEPAPPAKEPQEPERPVGETPIARFTGSKDFKKHIGSLAGVVGMPTGTNELTLMIEDDEKPIARVIYIPPKTAPNEPQTEPFGFTIKLRDASGRCSRTLDEHINHPDAMRPALAALANAIKLAMTADLGDFGSTTANMTDAINAYRTAQRK